jgi:hypothetical protein
MLLCCCIDVVMWYRMADGNTVTGIAAILSISNTQTYRFCGYQSPMPPIRFTTTLYRPAR